MERRIKKSGRDARAEIAYALIDEIDDLFFKAFFYSVIITCGDISVPGEATGLVFHTLTAKQY